jgi:dynein light chain LC8-type
MSEKEKEKTEPKKITIKTVDMTPEMIKDVEDVSVNALQRYNNDRDVAMSIKKIFDKKYMASWHCIVGRNFSAFVTHETKYYIYFNIGYISILLWKSG